MTDNKAQDQPVNATSTLYGTVPLHTMSVFQVKDIVHLVLPRDADKIDPTVVKLLRPWL